MAKERKKYDDDDGRTIADMSEVTRPNLWGIRTPSSAPWNKKPQNENSGSGEDEAQEASPKPYNYEDNLSKEDRRVYILAAVGSGLAIAAVFGIVFAIFIFIIGHVHC